MKITDTENKIGSTSEQEIINEDVIDEISEKNLENAIKKGIKTPFSSISLRIMLSALVIVSVIMFVTSLMKYSELQREKEVLQDKIDKYENQIEELEYLIDSPVDFDYIVRVAREKLNLHLPDEIIYYNDTNE